MKKVYVLLAEGFEEIEALTPVDLLRRAGNNVILAGVSGKKIKGSHGIVVECDITADLITDGDMIVVPGGMPGSKNIAESSDAVAAVSDFYKKGAFIGAICAAPAVVLNPLGILDNRTAVCFPGFEDSMNSSVNVVFDNVAVDGSVITSRGVGCAFEFAVTLVEVLNGQAAAEKLAKQTLFK